MSRSLALVVFIFLVATVVHAPSDEEEMQGLPSLRWNQFALAPPRALSGDSPHYLVAVNSLVEDADFDLKNNYDQALRGDWDAGSRFRRFRIDRHVDVDGRGRELGTHSFFFAALLAFFAWPLAGTPWVEPLCVWLTCTAALVAVLFMAQRLGRSRSRDSAVLVFAALASPLLCYSRDVWTEPWIAAIWMALLSARDGRVRFLLGFLGTLIKFPFAVVPVAMGIVHCLKGRYRSGCTLLGSGLLSVATVLITVQWMFQDVADHRSLFHSGVHAGFRISLEGAVGLLIDPANGLLIFFPIFLWSYRCLRESSTQWLPVLAFFGVHAFYADWMGGTGFSSRYLVPMIPILIVSIQRSAGRSRLFKGAALYSLGWGLAAGFFPAIVYDRTPWGIFSHVWGRLAVLGLSAVSQ